VHDLGEIERRHLQQPNGVLQAWRQRLLLAVLDAKIQRGHRESPGVPDGTLSRPVDSGVFAAAECNGHAGLARAMHRVTDAINRARKQALGAVNGRIQRRTVCHDPCSLPCGNSVNRRRRAGPAAQRQFLPQALPNPAAPCRTCRTRAATR
jgi:hypothetical protein